MVINAQDQTLAEKIGDLAGREINHGQYLPTDQVLRLIMRRNLRRRSFVTELRTKINPQLVSGFTGFGKGFSLQDSAYAYINFFKVCPTNFSHIQSINHAGFHLQLLTDP